MRKAILLLLLPVLGFAPAPVFRERADDPDVISRKLQGGWRGVSYQNRGENQLVGSPFRVHLEKDHWRFFTGSPPSQTNRYTITLDTKSNPMRIDWREGGSHLVGLFELKVKQSLAVKFFLYDFERRAVQFPDRLDFIVFRDTRFIGRIVVLLQSNP